ncbi:flavin-containing monooxygenase [Paenibacillus agricola]|uniref:NAD(P)/FAD-dependent oxidoreductase n=1 Tax=Paenibacillus agricola TaxID=2716264 RepID=A0ABX0JCQ8_9BACL|nr:NAD(P)/FAD-dependent oxidoreductase [Paenibacillus agricola]NHN33160.1 NAD(P)/FAD-dependent oxidoreductase [Paenibacillus agricola]
MNRVWDTIVIGGGQAGLASGYHLQKKGLQFLILEARQQAVGSWPNYYDSLKLFSPARFSSLPGMRISASAESYPLKEEVIRYLAAYSKKFQLPIVANQQVEHVQKNNGVFEIRSRTGESYLSKTIINASGSFHSPYTPTIKGRDEFQGQILHSSKYRNPDPFANQRVVVVGRGNSAVQIAVELSEVSQTSLAVLRPVQFMKQRVWGHDLHFWIKIFGLDTFPFWRFGKNAPSPSSVIDLGLYKERLAAGKPDQQPMFHSLFSNGVIWPDGKKEAVDTIIFATGYRPNLGYLKDIGALDPEGRPLQIAGVSAKVPGIYYVGLEGQRSFASATLRGVGADALYVVRQLMRHL